MTVPRSKIKTGYYRRVPVRSFVVELYLSFLLTQPAFVIGSVSVAPRRCATASPRASGPTKVVTKIFVLVGKIYVSIL